MPIARLVIAVLMLMAADASAQVAPSAPAPPSAVQQPAPPAPGTALPAGTTPAPAATPAVPTARAFTAPTGIILNAVRPERAVDFELVIGYVQAALAKSASPQIRAQAGGWRMFKATEPGPNNTVLYIFLLDPAVAGADYALGPILSDAYPEQVEQIWKLYQGALAGAGSQSLLNLTPVEPPPLPPAGAPVPPPAGTVPPPGTMPPGATPSGTAPAPTAGPAVR
jgi:hypothetical protein